MATTNRATRIEQQENIIAVLSRMLSDIELLARLCEDPEDHRRLCAALDQLAGIKTAAIVRRNTK